jgi:hypothetical protein
MGGRDLFPLIDTATNLLEQRCRARALQSPVAAKFPSIAARGCDINRTLMWPIYLHIIDPMWTTLVRLYCTARPLARLVYNYCMLYISAAQHRSMIPHHVVDIDTRYVQVAHRSPVLRV